MAEAKNAAPHKSTVTVTEQIAALENASLCDAMHTAGSAGCRDCARRLERQAALLLLAVLPPTDSIAALLAEAKKLRLSHPMAWPSIEQGNFSGVVRALEMRGVTGKTAEQYRNAADALSAQIKPKAA